MFSFIFDIVMKIAFWAKSIYDNKKRFRSCYVTLIGIVFTFLFTFGSDNVNISIISAVIGAFIALMSAINDRLLIKIFYKLFFSTETKFKICQKILITSLVIFAFVPLFVRLAATGTNIGSADWYKYMLEYFLDNTLPNITGAGVVIAIIYQAHKFSEENSISHEAKDSLEIIMLLCINMALLVISNYDASMEETSNFNLFNSIYLGMVISIGTSFLSVFLSFFMQKAKIEKNDCKDRRIRRLYPFSIAIGASLFIWAHGFSIITSLTKIEKGDEWSFLITNAVAIAVATWFGYFIIRNYVKYNPQYKNCSWVPVLLISLSDILCPIVCIIYRMSLEEFQNSILDKYQYALTTGITILVITFLICMFIFEHQKERMQNIYVGAGEILKKCFVDDTKTNFSEELSESKTTNIHIDKLFEDFYSYLPCDNKMCKNKDDVKFMFKTYILYIVFRINDSELEYQITNNKAFYDFCEMDKHIISDSTKFAEKFNNIKTIYENSDWLDNFKSQLKEVFKGNNIKFKYTPEIKYRSDISKEN